MTDDKDRPITSAPPGTPVTLTGWRDLPIAGDQVLQPEQTDKAEDQAKKAVENRIRAKERKALMEDVEVINEKRRLERARAAAEEEELAAIKEAGGDVHGAVRREERRVKAEAQAKSDRELRLIIKADVSGTVEAVVGVLDGIGNAQARARVIHTGVGDVSEADIMMGEASEATVIGFNVETPRSIEMYAHQRNVPLHLESVIYRLMDTVKGQVAALLPLIIEYRVKGESRVVEIFEIKVKGRKEPAIVAGCRVVNGVIKSTDLVRVLRGQERQVIWEGKPVQSSKKRSTNVLTVIYLTNFPGKFSSIRHLKKEVPEVRKGGDCGMALDGFRDIRPDDIIAAVERIEKTQKL